MNLFMIKMCHFSFTVDHYTVKRNLISIQAPLLDQ